MGKVTSVPEYLQDSQRTEDWFKQRIGKFTGSGIKKLMTAGRGKDSKWGDSAKEYVFSKLYERVSNSRIQTPETYAMMKGKEAEAGTLSEDADCVLFSLLTLHHSVGLRGLNP